MKGKKDSTESKLVITLAVTLLRLRDGCMIWLRIAASYL